jgi:hypothetical protein
VKAKTLAEVIRFFDPTHPLQGQELKDWYVDRPGNPLKKMETYLGLALNDMPVKILFTGHVGSGKSTGLNKLAEAIKNRFFIVSFNAARESSLADLTYVDLVLGMAMSLFGRATEPDVLGKAIGQITADYWETLSSFIEQSVFGSAHFRPAPPASEASVKVSALAAEFQLKFASEASTRDNIRAWVEPRLGELHSKIDEVANLVQVKLGRPVLFFVEGTDKTDLTRAREIFLNHTYSLTAFRAAVIYTVPISLRYANNFTQLWDSFNECYVLPNLNIASRDGTPNIEGLQRLEQALLARLDSRLLEPEAGQLMIRASGGLMRTLIRLTQRAAVNALASGAQIITLAHAQAAIDTERADYVAGLKEADYPILIARHADKRLLADEPVLRLLETRALLEYTNGDPWCDVHPIALPLILKQMASPQG